MLKRNAMGVWIFAGFVIALVGAASWVSGDDLPEPSKQFSSEDFEQLQIRVAELENAVKQYKAELHLLSRRVDKLQETKATNEQLKILARSLNKLQQAAGAPSKSEAAGVGKSASSESEKPRGSARQKMTSAGFTFTNVKRKAQHFGGAKFIGEVTNHSGKSYKLANFVLSVYTEDRQLIDTAAFVVTNLRNGQTKTFSALFADELPSGLSYKIDFENGF